MGRIIFDGTFDDCMQWRDKEEREERREGIMVVYLVIYFVGIPR